MKTRWIAGLAAVASMLAATPASALQSFDGEWILDLGRSSGLPPGMEQSLRITTEDDGLHVVTSVVSDFAERTQDDWYVFDGEEHDVQSPGIGSGKRTAEHRDDRGFSSVDRLEGPNGTTTIERSWALAETDEELTIELTATGVTGRTQSHRVFTHGRGTPPPPLHSRMFPVDLSVPMAPSPFRQLGKTQLVYELRVTNLRPGDIEWERLEVLDEGERVLAAFESDALAALLGRPGTTPALAEPRRIGAGMVAVAYLWIELEGETPKALRHRATFSLPAAASSVGRAVETPPLPVGSPAIVVGPPFLGSGWVARWNSNTSFHRRGFFAVDGRAEIAQRFAIDWNRYDEEGVEQSGDGAVNTTYSVYGQPVIAVADAIVEKVIDGVAENSPPNVAPGVGFDPEKALGNSVSLALSGNLFATYAHLQPGSIAVRAGERVTKGQVLGRVGNSGNATGPHLHFHIATGAGLHGEGVPYAIDSFEQLGMEVPGSNGATWDPAAAGPTVVQGELPVEHAVIALD